MNIKNIQEGIIIILSDPVLVRELFVVYDIRFVFQNIITTAQCQGGVASVSCDKHPVFYVSKLRGGELQGNE